MSLSISEQRLWLAYVQFRGKYIDHKLLTSKVVNVPFNYRFGKGLYPCCTCMLSHKTKLIPCRHEAIKFRQRFVEGCSLLQVRFAAEVWLSLDILAVTWWEKGKTSFLILCVTLGSDRKSEPGRSTGKWHNNMLHVIKPIKLCGLSPLYKYFDAF